MISEKYLKTIATKILSDCISEMDLIQNTEIIRDALYVESESFRKLSLLKTQINRAITSEAKGTISKEKFDVKINQIHNSLLTEINSINNNEIAVPFDYDDREGIYYLIYDFQGNHLYDFLGKLKDNRPHGRGIAKYMNGNKYDGEFKKGIREGYGKLMNKKGIIVNEGYWKNDKFYDKDFIEYYPDVKAAATSIEERNIFDESEVEKIVIPNLKERGLIAFPVEGDSMEPLLYEGDIVICKEINHLSNLQNNKIHVVCHDGTIWVKIVQKLKEINSDDSILLISENHLNHRPIKIEVNMRTKIFKLISQIKYF